MIAGKGNDMVITLDAYFRVDNTEGYTQEQLDELNRRLQAASGRTEISEDDPELDRVDAIAEEIQRQYDTELAGGVDWSDVRDLVKHVEGHLVFMLEAISQKNSERAVQQAREIEGWAQSMVEVLTSAPAEPKLARNDGYASDPLRF